MGGNTFTWDTQPTVLEKIADVDSSLFAKYQWVEIDVTDYVKEYYGEELTFSIWNEGQNNADGTLNFCSKETQSAGCAPQLVVE